MNLLNSNKEKLRFTKMHGLGNDYIYFNCADVDIQEPNQLAVQLSNRHTGVGGDGIVLIMPSLVADFRMRMFNADGSESEMCGNALRCVGKFVYDQKLTNKKLVTIETGAGVVALELFNNEKNVVETVRVNLGEPVLDPQRIPVNAATCPVINMPINILGNELYGTCVSMGNPHVVFFVDQITDYHVLELGPVIEKHELFPRRVNVEFAQVVNANTIRMRVWERGSGETMACGSGAAAVCVASVLNKKTERKVKVELLGGILDLEWSPVDNCVYKQGAASYVFSGEIESF